MATEQQLRAEIKQLKGYLSNHNYEEYELVEQEIESDNLCNYPVKFMKCKYKSLDGLRTYITPLTQDDEIYYLRTIWLPRVPDAREDNEVMQTKTIATQYRLKGLVHRIDREIGIELYEATFKSATGDTIHKQYDIKQEIPTTITEDTYGR